MRAGKVEGVANEMHEQQAARDIGFVRLTIEGEFDVMGAHVQSFD